MIVQIAVIGAVALMGLGVLSMLVSGVKSMAQGKQDMRRVVMMGVPFAVFAVSYFALGSDPTRAGVMTTLVMMGIMVVSIAFTGLRGTFKF